MRKVGASLEKWIEEYLEKSNETLKGYILNEQNRISTFNKAIEAILADRNFSKYVAEEHAESKRKEIRRCETKIAQYEKRINSSRVKEEAKRIAKSITESPFYAGFEIDDNNYLSLFTTNLVDAELRRNIGKFRICLSTKPSDYTDFRVLNLTYQNGRLQHWAINDAVCCQGEWANDFNNTLCKGRLDDFFTLFINYITLSPEENTYTTKKKFYEYRVKRTADQAEQASTVSFSNMSSFEGDEYNNGDENDEDDDEEVWL